jgi:pilus assembly protein Flp/PilA
MKHIDKFLRALIRDESGQDMIEYSLVAALIGLAAIVSIKGLSTHIASAFTSIGTDVTSDV